jgi:magnesium transporter
MVSELMTTSVLAFFEGTIERAAVLVLFIPLVMSSGGNSGSQAASLIIRALALDEIRLQDWWLVMRREIISGFLLGLILGGIGFARIELWAMAGATTFGPHHMLVACTVALTLVGIVLWGTIAGSMLPFVLKKMGFDPAVSSAPFVATLVDVFGIIIYFAVALVILNGTLL